MRVAKWNYDRNNTNLDLDLESVMLAEEAQEFKDGLALAFTASTAKEASEALVELIDAWADYKFVMRGTIYKSLGSHEHFNFDMVQAQEQFMFTCLTKDMSIRGATLQTAYALVIEANGNKGTEKVDGKIQKGPLWRDPKESILALLQEQRYV